MPNDGLNRVLIWLLITAVSIYLLERLLTLITTIATPLLLFSLAWLIALGLRPLLDRLMRMSVRRRGVVVWTMPRGLAVLLVYLALMAAIVICVVALVPVIGPQVASLQQLMPTSVDDIAGWATWLEREFTRVGMRGYVTRLLPPETLAQQAASFGSALVQQSLTFASSLAAILLDITFILILSFYMSLDGPRLSAKALAVLPARWRADTRFFFEVVDRTFGGFLRAQVLQGVLYGAATALLMVVFKLNFVALASLIAAILVLIPIIGGVLGVIPPLLVALVQAPGTLLPLLIGLIVVQQILFNVIMPRLMGQIIGLHPLLVFAAILVGGALAGLWGVLFGIPVAGVLAAAAHFIYVRATGLPPAAPPVDQPADEPVPNGATHKPPTTHP